MLISLMLNKSRARGARSLSRRCDSSVWLSQHPTLPSAFPQLVTDPSTPPHPPALRIISPHFLTPHTGTAGHHGLEIALQAGTALGGVCGTNAAAFAAPNTPHPRPDGITSPACMPAPQPLTGRDTLSHPIPLLCCVGTAHVGACLQSRTPCVAVFCRVWMLACHIVVAGGGICGGSANVGAAHCVAQLLFKRFA